MQPSFCFIPDKVILRLSGGAFFKLYLASRLPYSLFGSQFFPLTLWDLSLRPNIVFNPMPIVATIKLNGNYQEIIDEYLSSLTPSYR